MKQFAFAVAFFAVMMGLGAVKAQAQKIGYISMDELVTAMPEAKKADTALMQYRDSLGKMQQDMNLELNSEISKFIKDSVSMTQTQKEMRRKQLQDMSAQLQSFPQDAQARFQQRQQDVFDPIQKKAVEAIKAVAKENGYAYVISKENLIVSPPGDDIFPLVKKKLGIQ